MKEYDSKAIEAKWQAEWEKNGRFNTADKVSGKENAYVLVEFPYPSGKGLHCGHVFAYTTPDIFARILRLKGKNVLFPFGVDAFGLEAERTAIREQKLPQEIVARNTATFYEQIKRVGYGIDWSRAINSSDEGYYKWTQWLFLQFYKMGQIYSGDTQVNWCPNCGILANEELENGTCCQCHAETTQKTRKQWCFKMTSYADRLIDGLKETKYAPHVKLSQENYIGRSYGLDVDFATSVGEKIRVYTTCPETIYGATFLVVAPDAPIAPKLLKYATNKDELNEYIKKSKSKTEFERTSDPKNKSGCEVKGLTAKNPLTNAEIKIYLGDFVLGNYANGCVMAVPAHDQRDFEFAKQHNIKILQVISGDISARAVEKAEYLDGQHTVMNSAEFDGQVVESAKVGISQKLIDLGIATKKVNYKMHDWVFARQRYWGEPIPLVHCPKCEIVPVPESELPLTLPKVSSYEPTKDGESPLAEISDWVNCKCPKCGAAAKRETDTMPGWAGSSWYFMRYLDPKNETAFASAESLAAWLPVGWYFGGNEHTTRHLLYSRYWQKMLFDLKLVPVDEPYLYRYSHGIILGENGVKMSKSLGNVVDPREIIEKYGADALRLGLVFMGDYGDTFPWSETAVSACRKFLNKVWALQEKVIEGNEIRENLLTPFHTAIKKITFDAENIKFNTSVAALMSLYNEIKAAGSINRKELETYLILLNPFAPHITEEIWEAQKFTTRLADARFPEYNETYLFSAIVDLPVQVNGKMKKTISVAKDCDEAEALSALRAQMPELLADKEIKKVIFVKNKILNLIIN
ncbi:MAG: leucine--tRNA ligase [Christensenellaceae bacterium]|jgi:leucyl-tRNA synthetase|nr:leucine--tRNA ligase [Christensenellaceae bacterium]